jgi:hypothetical protein
MQRAQQPSVISMQRAARTNQEHHQSGQGKHGCRRLVTADHMRLVEGWGGASTGAGKLVGGWSQLSSGRLRAYGCWRARMELWTAGLGVRLQGRVELEREPVGNGHDVASVWRRVWFG